MATREPEAYGVASIGPLLEYGASPRGSLGLLAASRAMALLRGRDYVLPGDVADIAPDVLAHRVALKFDAVADGVEPRAVIDQVLQSVHPPQIAPRSDDFDEVAS
jgi:MoxR-like ATPase